MALVVLTVSVSCVESPAPEVQDLVTIFAPTFGGSSEAFISSPNQNYTIQGECDPAAVSSEYSLDQITWTSFTCTDGKFTIPVAMSSYVDIWARSKGRFSSTRDSHARIRFLLPPTSDAIIAASSSRSQNSDLMGPGTQNIVSHSIEGSELENTDFKLRFLLPRWTYEH